MRRRHLALLTLAALFAVALAGCTEASRTAAPYPDGGIVRPGPCPNPWKMPDPWK